MGLYPGGEVKTLGHSDINFQDDLTRRFRVEGKETSDPWFTSDDSHAAPRNNVSKATSEWRVVTSVQPSPLLWLMWPGSNKNGNQINPATLQVEGCLIELSKAWLRLRMIMPGNGEGSISPSPTRTPYISPCSFPTPLWNVSKITAHLPLACLLALKVICRLKDSGCQSVMNAMYTDKSGVRSRD